MILLQFINYEILNALVPVSSIKPKKTVCFYDDHDISDNRLEALIKTIRRKVEGIEIELVLINRFDSRNVVESIISKTKDLDDDYVFDITGDCEIVAASMAIIAHRQNKDVLCANIREGYVFNCQTNEKYCDIEKVTIQDYLEADGAKQIRNSRIVPSEAEYDSILKMAEWTFENQPKWSILCDYLSNHGGSFGKKLPEKINGYRSDELVQPFIDNGFVKIENEKFVYVREHYKQYLTTYGIWLELYVFVLSHYYFDETQLGVVIDWENTDEDTIDNEIDVLAIKDSRPYFISCKNRKPVPKDLYEVAYLANRFGGELAVPILATTYDFSIDRNSNTSVYYRFDKLKVGRIIAKDFCEEEIKDVFEKAIAQTKK